MRTFATAFAVCALVGGAHAYSLFNFEGFAPGTYTNLSQTSAGLTLNITRNSGELCEVFDNQAFLPDFPFPLTWDNRSLSPFNNATLNDYFIGDFSQGVSAVELEMTDFNQDADDLIMEVWSGTGADGSLLATITASWGANETSPSWRGLGWNDPSKIARSIKFRGGSPDFPNSMFVDNIAAQTAVPEPATMAALGLGVAALLRRRRK